VQLASSSDFIYPSSPDFSPSASPVHDRDIAGTRLASPTRQSREARSLDHVSERRAARSNESSPTREGLSLSVKSDVQKLVGTALKPFYLRNIVSKEEYTDINRSISRMLYERVGKAEALRADAKAKLQEVASEEVTKAVEALPRWRDKASDDKQCS
jgi:hypothetical protein